MQPDIDRRRRRLFRQSKYGAGKGNALKTAGFKFLNCLDLDRSIDSDGRVLLRHMHAGGSKVEVPSRRMQAAAYPVAACSLQRNGEANVIISGRRRALNKRLFL